MSNPSDYQHPDTEPLLDALDHLLAQRIAQIGAARNAAHLPRATWNQTLTRAVADLRDALTEIVGASGDSRALAEITRDSSIVHVPVLGATRDEQAAAVVPRVRRATAPEADNMPAQPPPRATRATSHLTTRP